MTVISRRQFLLASTAAIGVATDPLVPFRNAHAAPAKGFILQVENRVIEVNRKPASVFGIVQPNGRHGLETEAGARFRGTLKNQIENETLIHWHGLTPPWQQDGVPGLSQAALAPGTSYEYDFPLARPGTNWMHSHHGLQEQQLMAAPLIVRDPKEAGQDVQEVVVILHDFTFRDPAEILAEIKGGSRDAASTVHGASPAQPTMDHGAMSQESMAPKSPAGGHGQEATGSGGHGGASSMAGHLHDVEYDAFLANDRTLADPEVFRVEPGGRVRLRLINAATTTNFWIDLNRLEGTLIAVDGMAIQPLKGSRFEFAIAQRLDILLALPKDQGTHPIFAIREGDTARTGFVLATKGAPIRQLPSKAESNSDPVGLRLERRLTAAAPLPPRPAGRRHTVTLTEAAGYVWSLNGAVFGAHTPLKVRASERVEITLEDRTTMAHPIHLHGHHFQIVAINGERFAGAMRDTVLVPMRGTVTIAFEANNPGKWALHCHNLYHMAAGMMTTMEYEA